MLVVVAVDERGSEKVAQRDSGTMRLDTSEKTDGHNILEQLWRD